VSKVFNFRIVPLALLAAGCSLGLSQDSSSEKLEKQFQVAASEYESGHFSEAAAHLEVILPKLPNSFEVHELLGLVYASQSNEAKALPHLEAAVRIKPDSATARTNLATLLSRTGKADQAGQQFRKAQELQPQDFDTNHNLGEFYVQSGRVADARPFLEKAQNINPTSYDNGYDLALAYLITGQLSQARQTVQDAIRANNTGELHNLLAQIEEKDGKYIVAANEFETAAHMDPSEENMFAWGSELLLHRTYDPAIEVFQSGVQRYPNSARLQIGLGMTQYSRGRYDDAVAALIRASDLAPSDARCYLFLSKAYLSSPNQVDEAIQRFKRYAELQPANGLAQYYYGVSLWKGKRTEDAGFDLPAVESLLKKAVALDESIPEVHLQLGNLYADQHLYDKSIAEYKRALDLDPKLTDARYRLGQDYVHTGQKEQAKAEFALYQKLQSDHLAEVDKERAEILQFVTTSKPAAGAHP